MFTGDKVFDNLVTNNINYILMNKNKRTLKQKKVVELYEDLEDQTLTGEKLGYSQRTVSYILKTADWRSIKIAENRLIEAIKIYSDNIQKKKPEILNL